MLRSLALTLITLVAPSMALAEDTFTVRIGGFQVVTPQGAAKQPATWIEATGSKVGLAKDFADKALTSRDQGYNTAIHKLHEGGHAVFPPRINIIVEQKQVVHRTYVRQPVETVAPTYYTRPRNVVIGGTFSNYTSPYYWGTGMRLW